MSVHLFPRRMAPPVKAPVVCAPILSEAFGTLLLSGAAPGFVLAALPPGRVLWVQDRLSRVEFGLPFVAGMSRPLLRLGLGRASDVLCALEDGLQSHALAGVVGEIHGSPRALDFTASRRLALRAEAHGMPCWLIRHATLSDASAARMRWRIAPLPSAPDANDADAPGEARWRAELFRARGAPPSSWIARYDRTTDRLDFSAMPRDPELDAPPARTGRDMAR